MEKETNYFEKQNANAEVVRDIVSKEVSKKIGITGEISLLTKLIINKITNTVLKAVENVKHPSPRIIARCVAVAMATLITVGSLTGCDVGTTVPGQETSYTDNTEMVMMTNSQGDVYKTPEGDDIALAPVPAIKEANIVNGVFMPRSQVCQEVKSSELLKEAEALGADANKFQLSEIGAGMCVPEYYEKAKNFTRHNSLHNTGVKTILYTNDTIYIWAYCNSIVSDLDPNFANFSLLEYNIGEDAVSDLVYLLNIGASASANLMVQEISRKYSPNVLGENYVLHTGKSGMRCTMKENTQAPIPIMLFDGADKALIVIRIGGQTIMGEIPTKETDIMKIDNKIVIGSTRFSFSEKQFTPRKLVGTAYSVSVDVTNFVEPDESIVLG